MSDLIVKAAVKDAFSDHNVSADFYDALNEEVSKLFDDAAECAELNDWKTVQPCDLYPYSHYYGSKQAGQAECLAVKPQGGSFRSIL